MKKKNEEITFKDIIDIFLPKLWIIALVAVLFAGAVFGYTSFLKDDTYTSSSTFYVYADKNGANTTTSDIQAAEKMVQVYNITIKGDTFLTTVAKELPQYELTPARIRSAMSIVQVDDAPFFNIVITSADAELSYALADKISNLVASEVPSLIDGALLATCVDRPVPAYAANSKNLTRNTVIAFLTGAVVAALAVWVFSMFDVVIRSPKKIEDSIDIPVLGVIPRHEINLSEEQK